MAVAGYAALVLLLVVLASAQDTEFLVYPSNVTAPLGSNVTLECVADQPVVAWILNDIMLLSQSSVQELQEVGFIVEIGSTETVPGGSQTTITIPASLLVNDTVKRILCSAGPNKFELNDGPAVAITVYGLPLSPGPLEVSPGEIAGQLRLSWSPPFTLPGESLSYSLLATDLTTGLNQSLGPLSDTVYTHQVSESLALSCHLFLFSVSSLNEVGLSINSSSAPPALHPSAPGPLGSLQVEVTHNNQAPIGSKAILHLTFQRPLSCFPLNYSLSLSDELCGNTTMFQVLAMSVNGYEVIEVGGLRENTRYSAVLTTSNHFQFSILSPVRSEVSFVTSGLQSVAVVFYENRTVRITCSFASGSLSSGCQVFLFLDSSNIKLYEVSRNETTLVVDDDRVPSSVEGRDIGIEHSLFVSGTVIIDSPIATIDSPTAMSDSPTSSQNNTHDRSDRVSPGAAAGIALALSVVVVLPLGVLLGCCGRKCIMQQQGDKKGLWNDQHRGELEASYEVPIQVQTAISATNNVVYEQVIPVTKNQAYGEVIPITSNQAYGQVTPEQRN